MREEWGICPVSSTRDWQEVAFGAVTLTLWELQAAPECVCVCVESAVATSDHTQRYAEAFVQFGDKKEYIAATAAPERVSGWICG